MTPSFNSKTGLSINTNQRMLHKLLFYYLVLVFVTTAINAFFGYYDHHSWTIGDWLINYQGGMVRRGLLGEFIYNLSQITQLNPGIVAFIIQIILYSVFFIYSYLLLTKQHSLLPYVLLIISPFIFTFQIYDVQGGYRKEIMYIAVLAFVIYTAKSYDEQKFKKTFYGVLLLYPVLILTHEMLALFLPYLLVVYVLIAKVDKREIFKLSLILTPSIIAFFVSIYFSGTSFQVHKIFQSLNNQGYVISGGAIHWLNTSTSNALIFVKNVVKDDHYLLFYPQILALSLIAYIPLKNNLHFVFKKHLSKLLIAISILGSIALSIVAIDWGRFIYTHLVSLFLLSLLATNKSDTSGKTAKTLSGMKIFNNGKVGLYLLAPLFLLYSQFWYLPHCCNPHQYYKSNYTQKVASFFNPYERLAGILYRK